MSTTPLVPSPPSSPARRGASARCVRLLAAAAALPPALVGLGCSHAPPTGTPIVRAVPVDDAPSVPVATRDGVIVLFRPGDRIDLTLDVDGELAHVEGDGHAGTLVVDREFMVWSGRGRAAISFDDGRTWRAADRALAGEFGVDWRRDDDAEGGGVNEVVVTVGASPR